MWTPKRVVITALIALTTVAVFLSLRGGNEQTVPTAGSAPASVPPALTDTAEADTSTTEIEGGSVEVDGQPLPAAPSGQFEQSADGARAAAVTYLESTETGVTLRPAEAAAWARESASAAYADEFAADTEAQMIELWDTVPAGIILRLAPIATRVDPDGDGWRGSRGVVGGYRRRPGGGGPDVARAPAGGERHRLSHRGRGCSGQLHQFKHLLVKVVERAIGHGEHPVGLELTDEVGVVADQHHGAAPAPER